MAFAYCKKIARVNLTTGTVTVETPELNPAGTFIGGRGLGTKILYEENCATADPLGPDNKLVYITGPLTGTDMPFSGRYMVVTKSPVTGMLACANSGSPWGARLKRAGWDALIVEGQAPQWTYIHIADDKIELLDARELLGLYTEALDDKLKETHGKDSSALSIGIAGEKQVLLSVIMNDKDRAFGRGGIGAVMGNKRLKAIVVTASSKQADACPDSAAALKNAYREVPVNVRKKTPATGKKAGACHRCPIACSRWEKSAGNPKYESTEVSLWCNAYGLDSISVPQAIAAAMELYQQGAIPEEACTDISGNALSPTAWIQRIGDPQTPLDRLISSGADRLSGHYGVSLQKEHSASGKKDKPSRALSAVIDSMGLCLFTSTALGAPEYARLLNAACGTQYTPEEILQIGEDICHLERAFNELAVSHSGNPAI